jgi:dihydrofolate reductase
MNGAKKYVASRTRKTLQWENSVLLTGDVVEEVVALKAQRGNDLQIVGSGNLIQSLQAASLIDEYIVWTFPVILGHGKRLFETTVKPEALRLISTKSSPTGVVMSTYVSAGDIAVGTFAQGEPSE